MANTLAYYDTAIITAVKSFIVLAPGHVCKSVAFQALCTVETSPADRLSLGARWREGFVIDPQFHGPRFNSLRKQ